MGLGRVRVESPRKEDMSESLKSSKKPNYFLIILLVVTPILLLAAGAILFLKTPLFISKPYEFYIVRFASPTEVYSGKTDTWTRITLQTERQMMLYPHDKIRTGEAADVDLKVQGTYDLRIQPASEIEVMPPRRGSDPETAHIKVLKGVVLGLAGNQPGKQLIEIDAPTFSASMNQALFSVKAEEEKQSSVSLLKGESEVGVLGFDQPISIQALEILTVPSDPTEQPKPRRVTYQEWRALSEARDLIAGVSAEKEAEQIDLRKQAGSLFQYAFDEGVFFKPKWGYADREFYEDEEEGKVLLRINYDVYPEYSYSGMYFKTRNLDLSKVHRITFSLKSDPDKPVPDQFRIELKDNYSTVRGFAVKPVQPSWRFYSFDFNAQTETPVTEITFVFENTKVGPLNTNSTVYLKDLVIE